MANMEQSGFDFGAGPSARTPDGPVIRKGDPRNKVNPIQDPSVDQKKKEDLEKKLEPVIFKFGKDPEDDSVYRGPGFGRK